MNKPYMLLVVMTHTRLVNYEKRLAETNKSYYDTWLSIYGTVSVHYIWNC